MPRAKAHQTIEDGTLSITLTDEGSRRRLALSGELDAACAGTLREQIAIAQSDEAAELLIDLGGLDFIDSIGIEAIYRAAERSREDGSKLGLVRGSSAVSRTFELMGLEESLPFVD